MKKIFVLSILLTFIACFGQIPQAFAQLPTATMSICTVGQTACGASQNVTVGNTVSVEIRITNAYNTAGFQADLNYNSTILQYNSLQIKTAATDFLGSSGRAVYPVGPTPSANKVVFGAFTFGTGAGVSGDGVLATATFTAIANGSATLSLTNVSIGTADPTPLNQPHTEVNHVVTVSTVAPSPSPSATPGPSTSPASATMVFQMLFQGVDFNGGQKTVRVAVKNGTTTVIPTTNVNVTGSATGLYSNSVSPLTGLTSGVAYTFYLDGPSHLQRTFNVTLPNTGANTIDLTSKINLSGDAKDTSTDRPDITLSKDKVDVFDYSVLVGNFGTKKQNDYADFDFNGAVDIYDYSYIVANFNQEGEL